MVDEGHPKLPINQNPNTLQVTDLKHNEAQSARAESTHKGVNYCSKYVTQVQQQRPESPTVTLTWHTCKYEVDKLHQRYILTILRPHLSMYLWWRPCTHVTELRSCVKVEMAVLGTNP